MYVNRKDVRCWKIFEERGFATSTKISRNHFWYYEGKPEETEVVLSCDGNRYLVPINIFKMDFLYLG